MLDWHTPFLPYIAPEDYAGAAEGLKNFLRVFGRAYIRAHQERVDIPVSTTVLLETALDMLEEMADDLFSDEHEGASL